MLAGGGAEWPPFTVLHVCMGNICRSPMAERLLARGGRATAARRSRPAPADGLLRSVSAGTGGWHEGEEMNPPAARQVLAPRRRRRPVSPPASCARDLIDAADLVLTATADQYDYVVALRPDAAARTFVLGEFGRLLAGVDADALPQAEATPGRRVRPRRRDRGGRCTHAAAAALRRWPPTTWTTRGAAATRPSAGSPTRSRRRSSRCRRAAALSVVRVSSGFGENPGLKGRSGSF